MLDKEDAKKIILNTYKGIAKGAQGGCCSCGCGCLATSGQSDALPSERSVRLGYSAEEIRRVPQGSNLGLGCGNPLALLTLKEGETVLDLGSGGGFDSFLASERVGLSGRVIGVDMTPEMVSLARENATKQGYKNVEFRLGEIENLPVESENVDVVISNCVINLSLDKAQVFKEIFRVLKPEGRLCISDVVATKPIPKQFQDNPVMLAGCVAGAMHVEEIRRLLEQIGFVSIQMRPEENSREIVDVWFNYSVSDFVASYVIQAIKPKR